MDENEPYRNRWSEWSVSDITFLEVNYRTMPLAEIARTLGRTPGSVRLMAHKLACQDKTRSDGQQKKMTLFVSTMLQAQELHSS